MRPFLLRIGLACSLMAFLVGCDKFSAASLTPTAPRDKVGEYEAYFASLIENYNEMAKFLGSIEDQDSAEAANKEIGQLSISTRSKLSEMQFLPELNEEEADRFQKVFSETLRGDLESTLARLSEAANRAAERAPGTPALNTIAEEFHALNHEIKAYLSEF